MKKCAKCGIVKPLDQFHRQPKGPMGRHSYCKPCANAAAKAKRIRHDTPERRKTWNLSQRYGLTPELVDGMIDNQGGLCAICGNLLRRPVVDHRHSTGKVRGIICTGCNIKLSPVEDVIFREKALAYLEKYK